MDDDLNKEKKKWPGTGRLSVFSDKNKVGYITLHSELKHQLYAEETDTGTVFSPCICLFICLFVVVLFWINSDVVCCC